MTTDTKEPTLADLIERVEQMRHDLLKVAESRYEYEDARYEFDGVYQNLMGVERRLRRIRKDVGGAE
jgi:hypothetical protein